jgi:iron complex transport system substrate-binding protein
MRIVSLLPSATEIVYALGLEEELEGVTHECDHPAAARDKRRVSDTALALGAGTSPAEIDRLVAEMVSRGDPLYVLDEAAIRDIRPDLILAQDLCRVCAVPSGQVNDALDKLGCTASVISLDPSSLTDVLDGILDVGRMAGRATRAEALVGSLRSRVAAVHVAIQDAERPRALALEWSAPPFAGGHWIPEMVEVAGAIDSLGAPGEPSRRLSWVEVARSEPDVIVYMPCGYGLHDAIVQARALYDVPEIASSPAGRAERLFAVDASSYFSRPGPRLVDGLEILAGLFHPQVCTPPPMDVAARVARPRA